ncbi:hypothetical protein M8J75_011020 [Diaphorina citri]|nr:hypothetical protein M8J75_011020 [Diaphorina citri]KAI5752649.1 hypothetical protein M8J77_019009 [Diaphorina citri]
MTIITLTYLGVGATFTETLLGDLPRGAHIITKTTCELLRIQYRDFVEIKERNKDVISELQMNTKIKNDVAQIADERINLALVAPVVLCL